MADKLRGNSLARLLFLGSLAFAPFGLQAAPASLGRIAVRTGTDGPEFSEVDSGKTFTPRGVNWVLLSGADKRAVNTSFSDPAFTDALPATMEMFRQLAELGYNVVRIRPDSDAISLHDIHARGLDARYVGNLVTFLDLALRYGIRIELTGYWIPKNYYSVVPAHGWAAPQAGVKGANQILMDSNLAAEHGAYLADLLLDIKRRSPGSLSAIFALDLWNELYFDSREKPFSALGGQFKLEQTGKVYDLGNATARQQLADDATAAWIGVVMKPIRAAAPGMLLTSSVFSPAEVHRKGYTGVYLGDSANGDPRSPLRLKVLESTMLDFLEIHPYPHRFNPSIDADFDSMEWKELKRTKPVLVGEFGAYREDFPSLPEALAGMESFLHQLRLKRVNGWIFWTWNTTYTGAVYPLWGLHDGGGYLARGLASQK
ncbi:MAG TPA: hypothetical protein VMC06_09830 [Opitutaceae bacterium]|nr:hypothetical protein [Opitutaceae bacterium]